MDKNVDHLVSKSNRVKFIERVVGYDIFEIWTESSDVPRISISSSNL